MATHTYLEEREYPCFREEDERETFVSIGQKKPLGNLLKQMDAVRSTFTLVGRGRLPVRDDKDVYGVQAGEGVRGSFL